MRAPYAVDKTGLWKVNYDFGFGDDDDGDDDGDVLSFVGSHGYSKIESLEFAFGDYGAQIMVPNVPEDWTSDGILFAFSDSKDALVVLDPESGAAVEVFVAFQTIDCEGLVFTTRLRDSYGAVVVDACD